MAKAIFRLPEELHQGAEARGRQTRRTDARVGGSGDPRHAGRRAPGWPTNGRRPEILGRRADTGGVRVDFRPARLPARREGSGPRARRQGYPRRCRRKTRRARAMSRPDERRTCCPGCGSWTVAVHGFLHDETAVSVWAATERQRRSRRGVEWQALLWEGLYVESPFDR